MKLQNILDISFTESVRDKYPDESVKSIEGFIQHFLSINVDAVRQKNKRKSDAEQQNHTRHTNVPERQLGESDDGDSSTVQQEADQLQQHINTHNTQPEPARFSDISD